MPSKPHEVRVYLLPAREFAQRSDLLHFVDSEEFRGYFAMLEQLLDNVGNVVDGPAHDHEARHAGVYLLLDVRAVLDAAFRVSVAGVPVHLVASDEMDREAACAALCRAGLRDLAGHHRRTEWNAALRLAESLEGAGVGSSGLNGCASVAPARHRSAVAATLGGGGSPAQPRLESE